MSDTARPVGRPRKPEELAPIIQQIAAISDELKETETALPKLAFAAFANGDTEEFDRLSQRIAELRAQMSLLRPAAEEARRIDREAEIERRKALYRHRIGEAGDHLEEMVNCADELAGAIRAVVLAHRALRRAHHDARLAAQQAGAIWPASRIDDIGARVVEELIAADFLDRSPQIPRVPFHAPGAQMVPPSGIERLPDVTRRLTAWVMDELRRQTSTIAEAEDVTK
jgi:hypothetical protein